MPYIALIIQLIYAAFCLCALREEDFFDQPSPGPSQNHVSQRKIALNMISFFALSFVLRAYFLLTQTNGDVKYYVSAMNNLLDNGFFGYYDRAKIVYPPFFNYVYCLLGQLLRLLHIPLTHMAQLPILVLKLPQTACDYLTAMFLYRTGARRDNRLGFSLCCLYILNPAVIFDSAYVGQVDSIYSLFVLLTIWCVIKRRSDIACFLFVIGFLFKYQTVFIFPVLLFGLLQEVFFIDFGWKKFRHYLLFGCLSIALVFAAYLPFIYDFVSGRFAPELMFATVGASIKGYACCSMNAYNLWTLLGYNLKSVDSRYLFLTAGTWGTIHIVLLTCGCFLLFWWILFVGKTSPGRGIRTFSKNTHAVEDTAKKEACLQHSTSATDRFNDTLPLHQNTADKTSEVPALLGAWLITGIFCFSVKMMCRYLFPAIALLYLTYALHPGKRLRRCVSIFSILYVPVIMLPLTCYSYEQYHDSLILPRVLSAGMIGAFLYLSYVIWKEYIHEL